MDEFIDTRGDHILGLIENLYRDYERRQVKNYFLFPALASILMVLALVGYATGFFDPVSFRFVFLFLCFGLVWAVIIYFIQKEEIRRIRKELREEPIIREKISFEEPPYTMSRW